MGAELVTSAIDDGTLLIVCEASDRWRNTSTASGTHASLTLNVDNTAATALVVSPEDGAADRGQRHMRTPCTSTSCRRS
jgi:hypothetical protein